MRKQVSSFLNLRKIFCSVMHFIYLRIYPKIRPLSKKRILSSASLSCPNNLGVKIAFICDEMTWLDFSSECSPVFLHPQTWRQQLKEFQPEILFCESAWSGIDEFKNCWRGKIYLDKRIGFENRVELLSLLEVCKTLRIPTVFWNKEDPVFYDHPIYDFTNTAILFDFVFTTAVECIERYKKRGCHNVFLLPFGVNTKFFHPIGYNPQKDSVIFAGSWFRDLEDRCNILENLLDFILGSGMKLDIYDRKYGIRGRRFRFPAKYNRYIRPAVPFYRMPELTKQYEYAINVNTVTTSTTMLSRRVLQMVACGVTLISNESKGFEIISDCISLEPLAKGIVLIRGNFNAIKTFHSTQARLGHVLDVVAQSKKLSNKQVTEELH